MHKLGHRLFVFHLQYPLLGLIEFYRQQVEQHLLLPLSGVEVQLAV